MVYTTTPPLCHGTACFHSPASPQMRPTKRARRGPTSSSDVTPDAGASGDGSGDVDMGGASASASASGGLPPSSGSDLGSRYNYPRKHLALLSPLQRQRLRYKPKLPPALFNPGEHVCATSIGGTETQAAVGSQEFLKALFPKTYVPWLPRRLFFLFCWVSWWARFQVMTPRIFVSVFVLFVVLLLVGPGTASRCWS